LCSFFFCSLHLSAAQRLWTHSDFELLQTLNLRTILQNVKEEVSKNTIQPPLLVVFLAFSFDRAVAQFKVANSDIDLCVEGIHHFSDVVDGVIKPPHDFEEDIGDSPPLSRWHSAAFVVLTPFNIVCCFLVFITLCWKCLFYFQVWRSNWVLVAWGFFILFKVFRDQTVDLECLRSSNSYALMSFVLLVLVLISYATFTTKKSSLRRYGPPPVVVVLMKIKQELKSFACSPTTWYFNSLFWIKVLSFFP